MNQRRLDVLQNVEDIDDPIHLQNIVSSYLALARSPELRENNQLVIHTSRWIEA